MSPELFRAQEKFANGMESPPGPTAFRFLRAEEEPWLSACFVPPPEFNRMAGPHSCVIFGEARSGKTAIYRELLARNVRPDGRPLCLVVRWQPSPLPLEARPDLAWVRRLVEGTLDACASALVHHLFRFPEDYDQAPCWVRNRLTWFIHRYTLGQPEFRWEPLAEGQEPGAALIRHILGAPVPTILHDDAHPETVIAELLSALRAMRLEGVWVMTDGLEGWAEVASDRLVESLQAFLSTLSLFGPSGPVYKLFLPSEMEPAIGRAGGLARRRVEGIRIRWDSPTLQRLVEGRLAFAFGRETFPLEELCSAPTLREWLEKVGGTSPREWLDQVAVLAEHYWAFPQSAPIDEETWKKLRRQHPPRLYLEEEKTAGEGWGTSGEPGGFARKGLRYTPLPVPSQRSGR
jgi:hypothetical protein